LNLYLVDGTFELFRAYYGAPSRTGPDGREVGATRSLIRSLLALAQNPGVTHIACAFDHVIESFRNHLFDGYKTGEGIEPALKSQFHLAEEAVRCLGITVWPMVPFEADDALATAALRFSGLKSIQQVVICSPDKDLAQCVRGSRVVTYDRIRDRKLDENGVRGKYGVNPRSIPDLLALTGDSSDGIPGIPGWGFKSAAALLARYHRLEDIPLDEGRWDVKVRGAARLARNLRDLSSEALLYRTLAQLRTDVPLKEGIRDLAWTGVPRGKLTLFSRRIGDDRIADRVTRWATFGD